MAQITFEDVRQTGSFNNEQQGTPVGFFSLKNDGDNALVRFLHDSTTDFDILTTHAITLNGKHRRVSCVREDPKEPIDNCPLCKAGAKVEQRIYIHLLQYTFDKDGNVVVEPKVWERDYTYANLLRDKINKYGPLSKQLFTITRRGAAGYQQTKYDIDYEPVQPDFDTKYPCKPELFEGYKALGRAVLNKNAVDLDAFVKTGSFPKKPEKSVGQQPVGGDSVFTQVAPQQNTQGQFDTVRKAPWEQQNVQYGQQAPIRHY